MQPSEAPARRELPPAPATKALCGLIAGVFALQFAFGATEGAGLARMGATTPRFWGEGHYWTLASATLLHIGPIHAAMNLYFIWMIGRMLEWIAGPWRMLCVFFVGGLTGSGLSVLVSPDILSAGASGGAWGLMVGMLFVLWWPSLHDGKPRSQAASSVLRLVMLNGVISLMPGINGLAHLGGGLGGVAVLWLSRWGDRVWAVLAGALAVGHVAALGWALGFGMPWAPTALSPVETYTVHDGALTVDSPFVPSWDEDLSGTRAGQLWWEGVRLTWYVRPASEGSWGPQMSADMGSLAEGACGADCQWWQFEDGGVDVLLVEKPRGEAILTGVGFVAEGRERVSAVRDILASVSLTDEGRALLTDDI